MEDKFKTLIVVGVIVVLGVGAVAFKNSNKPKDTMNMDTKTEQKSQPAKMAAGAETTNQVTYKGFAVVQKAIKVKKGTMVTWTNEDSAKHDVTPDKESADFKASELFGKGETYSMTFNTVGTYAYHCSPHPYMKGVIEVTE